MRPTPFTLFRRQHGKRLLLLVAFLASLPLLCWTIARVLRVQREVKTVNANIQRLIRETELMSQELSLTNAPQAFEALRREEQRLLVSPEALTAWTERLQQECVPLVLEATPQVGNAVNSTVADRGFKVIPVTFELVPPKGILAAKPTYHRLLQFLNTVAQETPRVDLVEFTVQAESGAIERATVGLHVWVGEAAPPLAVANTPEPGGRP